jgi:hypothetical protein
LRYDLYGRKQQNHGRVQQSPSIMSLVTDKDTALIFSLIFLLKKERRDPMLILALLYILT